MQTPGTYGFGNVYGVAEDQTLQMGFVVVISTAYNAAVDGLSRIIGYTCTRLTLDSTVGQFVTVNNSWIIPNCFDILGRTNLTVSTVCWCEPEPNATGYIITPITSGSSPQPSSWKQPARAATTVAGTLSTSFANGSVIDGVTLATNDRILIKNQVTQSDNGIYIVNSSGAPTRTTDATSGPDLLGATIAIEEGTTNADTVWLCTANSPISVGTTALPWIKTGPSVLGTGTDTDIAIWNGTGVQAIKDSPASITSSLSVTPFAQLRLTGTRAATPTEHPIVDLFADEQNTESAVHLRYILAAATGAAGAGYDVVSSINAFGSSISGQRFEIRYIVSLTSTVQGICTFYTSSDVATPYTGLNVWDFSPDPSITCYMNTSGFIIPGGTTVCPSGTLADGSTVAGGLITAIGSSSFTGSGTIVWNGVLKTMTIVNGSIVSIV